MRRVATGMTKGARGDRRLVLTGFSSRALTVAAGLLGPQ
jgi:hypothetical protein